jgi:transcriptional regulator with XRE-family HTH domain
MERNVTPLRWCRDVSNIALKVGRRIRELREKVRPPLTQEELAERAEISVSFLSMIERGERCPHLVTLEQLATALAVELRELF